MDDLNKFIDAMGILAEVTTIYYNGLINAGIDEDHAVVLAAKVMGEILRSSRNEKTEEDKHE